MDDHRLARSHEEEPGSMEMNASTTHHTDSLPRQGEPLADQGEPEVTLREIVINCHTENAALDGMKVIIYGLADKKTEAYMEKIGPTTWKYHREIPLYSAMNEVILSVESEDGNIVGYVTFSKGELAAFMVIGHNTQQDREFVVFQEAGTSLKLTFILGTSQKVDIISTNPPLRSTEDASTDWHALDMSTWFSTLGLSFRARFEHTGNLTDLGNAISSHQKAINLIAERNPKMPVLLNSLGLAYAARFNLAGDLTDASAAICTHQRAVTLTPEGDLYIASRLNDLGSSVKTRFRRTCNLADLENAIAAQQKAINLAPEGQTQIPLWLDNLGASFQEYFGRTGNFADLENAIASQQRAIDLTPKGDASMPLRLNNLARSFQMRFEHTQNLSDLNDTIFAQQQAIDLTPEGHADMYMRLDNLGVSLQACFDRTGNLADLENIISIQRRVVDLAPKGNRNNGSLFMHLGHSLVAHFTNTHNIEDIHEAISMFRRAATQMTGNPLIRIQAARDWAQYSRKYDKSQLFNVYSVAIQLLPQIVGLEKTIQAHHKMLIDVSDITASATAVAIDNSNFETALAWLEQGRCLVWNQINHLRTPAEALRTYDPSLAARFLHVARGLELSASRQERHITFSGGNMIDMISFQQEVHTHVLLAKEWDELLQKIRRIPEFQDFLQPPQASDLLSHLPPDGPIVIFNIHEDRCDALALISGHDSPIHIPLKTFSLQRAIELRDDMRQYLTTQYIHQRQELDQGTFQLHLEGIPVIYNLLHELWNNVVKPILDALAYSPQLDNQPRIWWCPTGPLMFLPIHAAGIYGKEGAHAGSCVSDYVVSSYTPNISTLLNKIKVTPSTDVKSTSFLIIGQSLTPSQSPISGVEQETRVISDIFGPSSKSLVLENASATVVRVKEEMEKHSWLHLSCPGFQDVMEPLKSGVQLYDGRLDILEMLKQTLPSADLAFLSADQTSTGDDKLADEAVHLAAAMLVAGYRGVVATMWAIEDHYRPVLAKDFYDHILRANSENRRLDSANAAHALHYATRKVRKELGDTEEVLLTWVPYVHFGV